MLQLEEELWIGGTAKVREDIPAIPSAQCPCQRRREDMGSHDNRHGLHHSCFHRI